MPTSPRTPLRLLAVVAVAVLPAIFLAVMLLAAANRDVGAAQREQRGLEYLAAVKAFIKAALEHRRTAVDYIAGTADNVQVARRADAVAVALRDLEAIDARLGDDATHDTLNQLRGEWEAIRTNLSAWARADDFNAFWQRSGAMLGYARSVAETAADVTGLSANPDRFSHALQDTLLILVRDADHLSKAALLTRRAARAPRLERTTEGQLQRLLAAIEDDDAALKRNRAATSDRSAARYFSGLAQVDREDGSSPRRKLIRAIETNILREAAPVDESIATTVRALGDQAIAEDFELFDAASRALSGALAERIAQRERTIMWAVVAVIIGVTLALLVAYLVGRSITPPVAPTPPAIDLAHIDQLRTLADRVREVANGLGEASARVTRAGGQVARLGAAVRGIEPAARLLEELADESSVAAVNIELRSATGGGIAAAPEVDRLAERSAGTARRIGELARTAEAEAAALTKALRELTPAEAKQLESLAAELHTTIDQLK